MDDARRVQGGDPHHHHPGKGDALLPAGGGAVSRQFVEEVAEGLAVVDELEDLVKGAVGPPRRALEEVDEFVAILFQAVIGGDAVLEFLLVGDEILVPVQGAGRREVALEEDRLAPLA